METLFFLLLFDRSCRFPRCSNSKLSLSIPSVVQSKKSGTRHEHSPPQTILRSTPNRSIGSQSFPLENPFSTSFGGQPFVSKDRWQRCTLWNRISVPLSVEKHQKQLPSFMLRVAKKQKNHQDFDADWPAASKDTFFDFGGRLLDRWCSSSLALFSSTIYSCLGDLATCFTCLHQSKQAQKTHVVCEPWAWPSNMHAACLACSTRQPASPGCTVDLRRSLGW